MPRLVSVDVGFEIIIKVLSRVFKIDRTGGSDDENLSSGMKLINKSSLVD
jgi:hypothetical protein